MLLIVVIVVFFFGESSHGIFAEPRGLLMPVDCRLMVYLSVSRCTTMRDFMLALIQSYGNTRTHTRTHSLTAPCTEINARIIRFQRLHLHNDFAA